MADLIQPIPPVPAGLREAAQVGRLIPFVGAGVSLLAGCPGWNEFADGALRWLIAQGKFSYSQLEQVRHLNPRVKLSLARTLEGESGLTIDYEPLLHPKKRDESKKGLRLYRSLFQLSNRFVTTNYDRWLDDRIPDKAPPAEPPAGPVVGALPEPMRVVYKVSDLTPALLAERNTVIHLHGSVREPKEMILTTQDYVRHYANDRMSGDGSKENRVLTFLEYLFANRTVLFVGYGLAELEILEYVILKARRPPGSNAKEAKHYILQGFFSHEEALLRSLKSYYLQECGIELIPFLRDHKDFDQLIDVLEEIARLAPASEPLVLQKVQDLKELLNG